MNWADWVAKLSKAFVSDQGYLDFGWVQDI